MSRAAPASAVDERARLFIALELPADVREALERWCAGGPRRVPGLRMLEGAALHVTLCFLGWRFEREIDEIGAACVTATDGCEPFALWVGNPVWLPERRPRVLAVGIDDPSDALAGLQSALARELSAGGWYAPERRPFLGHVTVARARRGARVRPVKLPGLPAVDFQGRRVTLYRSRLGPGGARYEPRRTIALDRSPRQRTTAIRDPVSVVREFHDWQRRAYAGGDLHDLRPRLTEDVVWHVPGRSRISGEHRGIAAVLAYFEVRRTMTDRTFQITVHGMSLVGDRVVQLAGGRAVRDGSELSWETVGVFRLEGDRVAECWLVPFDLYAFDEIWA